MDTSVSTKAEPAAPRSCYYCSHYPVCGLVKVIRATLLNCDHIDIDGKKTPGKGQQVIAAVAPCCKEYKPL